MHAIEKDEKERAAELLVEAYRRDKKTQIEMEDVENSQMFLEIRAKDYVSAMFGRCAIWIEEEKPTGILIAYQNHRFSNMRVLNMIRDSLNHVADAADRDQLDRMAKNAKRIKRLENYVWHRKVPKKRKDSYYHIDMVSVEEEALDTDHIYDILEPFMSYCDRYRMLMTYESWNPEMTEIMKNLCFEVVKKKESRHCPGVVVERMVRQPQEYEKESDLSKIDEGYDGETEYDD